MVWPCSSRSSASPPFSFPNRPVAQDTDPVPPHLGSWRAVLASQGGPLPFTMELLKKDGKLVAEFVNGTETIEVPHVSWEGGLPTIRIEQYDSVITATRDPQRGVDGYPVRTRT